LAELTVATGTMVLTRSLTSGLTQRAGDPPGLFWGVGDRGPNIKPSKAARRYGMQDLARLADLEGAKILPLPAAGPHLARFRLAGDRIELEEFLPLRTPGGALLSALPPRAPPGMETEPLFDLGGTPLGTSPDGADPEGLAALPDGRFWVAEEYGPSLLLVGPDGVVQRRLVPQGTAELYAGATIPVEAGLPALAARRKLNRGFEALTLSPGGETLFAAFQSPLAHPDRAAHEAGDLVRIWALDPSTGALQAEFAYPLDHPDSFARDRAHGKVERSDLKVSELASLPDGSLLVLERATLSTHIHRILPKAQLALPSQFIDPDRRPTLEQVGVAGAEAAGIPLLGKQSVFSTDDHPDIPGDLEGMLVLDDGGLLLANDSDYGIEGAETQFWRVSPPSSQLS